SVYFASLFKSFRDDTEFIFLKESSHLELELEVEKEGSIHVLEVFLEKRDKVYANFRIDGVKKKRKEAQGFIAVVVFDPSDVDMFSKAPESRRKYLNMVLSQKNPEYLESLSLYKKALFQKTQLLQDLKIGKSTAGDFDAWNQQILEAGAEIIQERKKFINFLNNNIAEVYTAISGFHRPVEVWYESLEGENKEEISQNFFARLEEQKPKEQMLGTCLVGPHRDDFSLKSDGLFLPPFSSRGELRSQVLALKILELEYLSKGGEKPILLLDDVLSELDDIRREFLLKYLQGNFQVFITTTQSLDLPAQHITLSPSEEEIEETVEN
ncbi:MAG: DNA replication/repair protein RecF, partial [Candidatus Doudnabacteria bacterium]|nr:DNA replication/repair protein RecF [Candidatus Doudnabacteria bacterium]